ncbi:TetR/AcrR family transcriptional regulator [Subdoligranulum variabile]|uniref:TetR/AcrR family transcriptional regulator n=1 Tax=Subdoligranulum variabile TaxID=214851 RepID=UPI0026E93526|nr:TetR/AcrR family transcriptional regulator [Subdoligranulum variabile]
MKPAATSKEEILAVCRALIHSQGGQALNVRQVAAACNISVGTVYNYFGSKAELVGAAIESVWYDIFRCSERQEAFRTTQDCIRWLFARIAYGSQQYPGFFMLHSVNFVSSEKQEGKQRMQQAWQHILTMLCKVMWLDPQIRPDAFDENFTPEQFADLLFSLLLAAQLRGQYDPAPVLQLVQRTLYGTSPTSL